MCDAVHRRDAEDAELTQRKDQSSAPALRSLRLCGELHWPNRSTQKIKLTRAHFKAAFKPFHRVWPDEEFKHARLDREAQGAIVETEFFRPERERNPTTLARLQRDALKAFQFADGARDARGDIMNIKLHDFVARAPACVCDLDADRQVSVDRNAWCAQLQVRELKLRVTQPVAERIERRKRHVNVS